MARYRASSGMPNKWIADGLRQAGKRQVDLARHLGVSESVMTKMIHSPRFLKAEEAEKIRAFFEGVQKSDGRYAEMDRNHDVRNPEAHITVPLRTDMPEDVPVLGTALGGASGGYEFIMNGDSGLRVRRPPRLLGRDDIFALFVQGESMSPRYPSGELIFCESKRPPQIGDHVVVELNPDMDGVQVAYLKRLSSRSATKLKLEQYNPPKVLEIELRTVRQVVRVLTTLDLLGI